MRRQTFSSGDHMIVFKPSLAGFLQTNYATVDPVDVLIILKFVFSGLFALNFSQLNTKLSAGEYLSRSICSCAIKRVS